MINYIWLIVSVLLGAAGQILMKWGVSTPRAAGIGLLTWNGLAAAWPIGAGLACYGLSSIFWLFALRKFPLSTAYPMVSLGYILVMVLGYVLFKETLSMQKWFGAAFISVGVLLIARA
ncbi:SMR family transporter [Paenibacillus filicis]|uniref:SMR family transporter n=1 Tax=Paenibacillus gyeongsangnamensis TaxID=3388067 RepID=A0ABT4QAI0_9BACL|nr:SMR family transporter [Paenibacillus filicis]MCZ8513824.1 SMR family transporter [Paenibacillus filicis]